MRQENDAKGQFAKSQANRKNTGVASAKPTVITHSEDVTGDRFSARRKPKKGWNVGFDETAKDQSK